MEKHTKGPRCYYSRTGYFNTFFARKMLNISDVSYIITGYLLQIFLRKFVKNIRLLNCISNNHYKVKSIRRKYPITSWAYGSPQRVLYS